MKKYPKTIQVLDTKTVWAYRYWIEKNELFPGK